MENINDNNLTFVIRCQRIINTIYDYLDTKDVGNMRLVCKRSKISATKSLLKKMRATNQHFVIKRDKTIFDRKTFVKDNEISKVEIQDDEIRYDDSYKYVDDIFISNIRYVLFSGIDDAFTKITRLTIISMTFDIESIIKLKTLERLNFMVNRIINIESVALLTNLKRLKCDVEDHFVDPIIFKECKRLTHLHLCNKTAIYYTVSIESDTITKLTLINCSYQYISNLPKNLEYFEYTDNGGWLSDITVLPSTLKHLTLGYFNYKLMGLQDCKLLSLTIGSISVDNLFMIPTTVERLNVRLQNNCLLDKVLYSDKEYDNLKSLKVEYMGEVSNINRFKNLRSLDISFIPDLIMGALNHKFLMNVKIRGCMDMDMSLEFLGGVTSLRRLTIPKKIDNLDALKNVVDLIIYRD